MHKTIAEAKKFVSLLLNELADIASFEIVICPPFTALSEIGDMLKGRNIKLGAQNVFFEKEGAFTGEISPVMLKEVGVEYVIVGHSERRRIFKEDDELINKKMKAVIEYGMIPIFCVGETLEERKKGLTFCVVEKQVREGFNGLSKEDALKVIIAYEPVWAIGTGVVATPDQAQEVHSFIRQLLKDMYDEEVSENVRILYGGSIKPSNYFGLIVQRDIDGGLVGGASLKESFVELTRIMEKVIE